jgi:hypothetical protein
MTETWVRITGRMKLTGGDRSAGRETCLSVTLTLTNPVFRGMGLNSGRRWKMLATNRVRCGMTRQHNEIII